MHKATYKAVISGKSDYNIRFSDLQALILDLGFVFKRQNGSHIIYYNYSINQFINIQRDGAKAKAYEVKQLRRIINTYRLTIGGNHE